MGTNTPSATFGFDQQQNFGQTRTFGLNPGLWVDKSATANNSYLAFRTAGIDRWSWGTSGDDNIRLRNWASGNANVIYADVTNNTVGINTGAPVNTSKMHVDGYGISSAVQTSIYANGNFNASAGHGLIADGEWRGVWGRNSGTGGRIEASGIRGNVTGASYSFGYGAFGSATGTGTNNYGLYGEAANASGQNYAAWLNGTIRISDGTQAAGRVLTSNATGVASWQTPVSTPNVGISAKTLIGGTGSIPNTTLVPLRFSTVLYEDGGANYNPGTGEYTITVAGVYTITGSILWNTFSAPGTTTLLYLTINGTFETESAANTGTGTFFSQNVTYSKRLNAGDIVRFSAYQNSGATQNLTTTFFGQTFAVTLHHQ